MPFLFYVGFGVFWEIGGGFMICCGGMGRLRLNVWIRLGAQKSGMGVSGG